MPDEIVSFEQTVLDNIGVLAVSDDDPEDTGEREPAAAPVRDPEKPPVEVEGKEPPADEGRGGDDSDKGKEGEDEEFDPPESLEELAEILETPLENLKGLKVKFKAAGLEQTKTLADLEKGFQLEADYTRSKQTLQKTQSAFEDDQKDRVETFNKAAMVLAGHFNEHEKALNGRLESPYMAELRLTDSNRYVLEKSEIEREVSTLQARRQGMAQQYDEYVNGQREQWVKAQESRVRQELPDWDQEKADSVTNLFKSVGFKDEEIPFLLDHRVVRVANELNVLRSENAALKDRISKGDKAAKELRARRDVKQVMKPGKGKEVAQKRGLSAAKQRFHQKRDLRSAADYLKELGDL